MSNPFQNWTPQMVADHNARKLDERRNYRNSPRPASLPAEQPKPAQGQPLERPAPRKKPRRTGTARRARIRFTFYAVRPCDYDGYTVKELQDLCCYAGLLDGDKWDQLECDGIRSEKVHSKEEERTEIVIIT